MRAGDDIRSGGGLRGRAALPLLAAMASAVLFVACGNRQASQSDEGPSGGKAGELPLGEAPAGGGVAAPATPNGCDPAPAIAAYPRFGGAVPEVVSRLYAGAPARDYPIIDAHTHLSTTAEGEAALQKQVGLYAAVHASWDADSTRQLRATYPAPYLIQFNLSQFFEGLTADKIPAILAEFDAQREAGAGGIKIYKDFGLSIDDGSGARLRVDDPRLYPLWQRAAELGWAVSIHVGDPDSWMASQYPGSAFTKQQLIEQFLRVVEDHPRTTFVAIHLLNLVDSEAELDQLGSYLARYPNLYADTAARSQYLVHRDPAHVREFVLANQDKLIFASDRVSEGVANYEQELRYWETTGPTTTLYLASSGQGLGLPPAVLEKLYYRNALRAFCGSLR